MSVPQGIILLTDESDSSVGSKLLCWLAVMIVYILILIHVTKYFNKYQCHKIQPHHTSHIKYYNKV